MKDNRKHEGQQEQQSSSTEYKNIETSVNNPSYFNDDYEAAQDEKMRQDEVNSEDENNVPNRRRPRD
jgi:hypothetical protein